VTTTQHKTFKQIAREYAKDWRDGGLDVHQRTTLSNDIEELMNLAYNRAIEDRAKVTPLRTKEEHEG
jgi:hypothetical protein